MKQMAADRTADWDKYFNNAMQQKEIWGVVIAKALKDAIEKRKMMNDFVYVHEAISDSAPFQYYLPFGTTGAKPISYYCVAGGSLGWSMPASLGIKLEKETIQGIGTKLVINAVGDGSSLFYPQTWWTAAHHHLPILYIITNNHEYHTLQLGLQQVVASYGTAPGYNWKPKTMDPSYLKLERPQLDFVSLAKAFGGQHGEIVKTPDAVKDAVERGIHHVLNNASSYILDMRIAANAPTTPSTSTQHYTEQPVLDVFHKQALKHYTLETDQVNIPSNMPSIF
jgi:benzoylformate decarboxylase